MEARQAADLTEAAIKRDMAIISLQFTKIVMQQTELIQALARGHTVPVSAIRSLEQDAQTAMLHALQVANGEPVHAPE